MYVTQKELAHILGVTPRTLRDWHALGLDQARDPETGNQYDLRRAVAFRLELERNRLTEALGSTNGDGPDLNEARARKEHALAQLRELEVGERSGELVRKSAVDFWLSDWAVRVRQAARSFIARFNAEMAGELGIEPRALAVTLDRFIKRWLHDVADSIEPPTITREVDHGQE